MLLNTVLVVVGVWAALGLRTGLWVNTFLLVIVVLTFEFAIFYAFSTLFGVLTRSPIVAILMTCLLWLILFVVGWTYRILDLTRNPEVMLASQAQMQPPGDDKDDPGEKKAEEAPLDMKMAPDWVYHSVDAVHFVLPRINDLGVLMTKVIVGDLLPAEAPARKQIEKVYASFQWTENLTVSGVFIALMLGLACWRFSTRDY
jgi:hypothetical protein